MQYIYDIVNLLISGGEKRSYTHLNKQTAEVGLFKYVQTIATTRY